MTRRRFVVVIALIAALGAAAPVLAQDAPTLNVAKVDINAIQAQFGELQAQQQQLEAWLTEQRRVLNTLGDNYLFLTQDHFEEALGLLRKTSRTEAEQARLDELRELSDTKDADFRKLAANANRTAQEQDRYNALQDASTARAEAIAAMWQETLAELDRRKLAAVDGLMGKVSEAIKAEAQAQGFELVIDADAVLYGGTDITQEVLARLNAGQPAPAGGGGNEGGGQ